VSEIKPGQPLTETELLTGGSNLYDHTGVFDWAEVDPKRRITTQTKEDVLVKVHEASKNEFTYGFGFEVINRGRQYSEWNGCAAQPASRRSALQLHHQPGDVLRPRGTVQYTRNNLRGKGESISATGFAGRLDQRAAFYYIDPNFRWTHWRATTSFFRRAQ